MSGFEVGILGGPGDGQLLCVPSRQDAMGPPPNLFIAELQRTAEGDFHPLLVEYVLRVNDADDGPLWFYARDPAAPELLRDPWDEDSAVAIAAQQALRDHHHG